MKIISLTLALVPFALAGCASTGGGAVSLMGRPASQGQSSGSVHCLEGQIAQGDRCVAVENRRAE